MEKKKTNAGQAKNAAKKPYYNHKKRTVTDSATGARIDADKRPKKSKRDVTKKAASGAELVKAIQWFPGHMTRAIREIKESLAYVDIAIELCDARIPLASRNPNVEKILDGKPYITVMNKAALADPAASAAWKAYFAERGKTVLFTDCLTGEGVNAIIPAVRAALADKLARCAEKGMNRTPRAMILGVTNSGKSTLINTLCGAKKTKTENRAGVTRQGKWVTVEGKIELFDTPGILWPKFDDEAVGLHLAYTGAIRDDVLDIEEIAVILLRELLSRYPRLVTERYKLDDADLDGRQPFEVFETIGRKRGLLMAGGEVDTLRCSRMLIDELRAGKIGRITFETP